MNIVSDHVDGFISNKKGFHFNNCQLAKAGTFRAVSEAIHQGKVDLEPSNIRNSNIRMGRFSSRELGGSEADRDGMLLVVVRCTPGEQEAFTLCNLSLGINFCRTLNQNATENLASSPKHHCKKSFYFIILLFYHYHY